MAVLNTPFKRYGIYFARYCKVLECHNDILDMPRIIIRPTAAGGLLRCLFCKDYILVTLK